MIMRTIDSHTEGLVRTARQEMSAKFSWLDLKAMDTANAYDLAKLDEECFDDLYYDQAEFLEEMQDPSCCGLVAYNGSQIWTPGAPAKRSLMGYVMVHDDTPHQDVPQKLTQLEGLGAYVISCAVHPQIQKHGLFRGLLSCTERIAQYQSLHYLRLHTRAPGNFFGDGCIPAFQHLGFHITGTIPDYYEPGDGVVEMVKEFK
jgi:ribosomal protein S18 acetylase RimI-like enzyme